jgi:hypothetical protein
MGERSRRNHWHNELQEHLLPSSCSRLIIYCTAPNSILTISADGALDVHINIMRGVNLLCLCNLSLSPDRIAKFLSNSHLVCRFSEHKLHIFLDSKNYSSTLLVTIRVSGELLSLAEESKIGFIKRRIYYMPEKTLKTFPIPIRELYHKPNIINETLKRYHGVFSHKNKYVYKWLQLRNCIKKCAISHNIVNFMPKPYPYGMFVYSSHKDWYMTYYLKNMSHERSTPVFKRDDYIE